MTAADWKATLEAAMTSAKTPLVVGMDGDAGRVVTLLDRGTRRAATTCPRPPSIGEGRAMVWNVRAYRNMSRGPYHAAIEDLHIEP